MAQTTEPFEEFTSVIRDLTEVAASISQAEDAKALAASEKRHEKLNGYIQEEQAYILKLRGLEQHRIKSQEAIGFGTLTLKQIKESASSEQLLTLSPAFEALETQLKRLEHARQAAEQMISVRIHEMEVFAQRGQSYDNGGKVSSAAPSQNKFRSKYV